jgi:hypothetical protein
MRTAPLPHPPPGIVRYARHVNMSPRVYPARRFCRAFATPVGSPLPGAAVLSWGRGVFGSLGDGSFAHRVCHVCGRQLPSIINF